MKQVSKLFNQTASGSLSLPMFATVLLLAVVFSATFAGAQTVAASSSDTSTLTGAGGHHGGGDELGELLDGIVDLDQILADALGITVEELEAAREEGENLDELIDELGLDQETVRQEVQDAIEAAVEQAVEDGLLTEEEAEAILNRPDHQQGGELKELLDSIVDHDQILADALGITVEALETAREERIKLDELIDELGLDPETVHQEVQDATEAAVEQAVEEGLLTEEEVEAILNRPARPEHGNQPPDGGRPGDDDSSESSTDPTSDSTGTENDSPITGSESTEPPGAGSPRGDGNRRGRR